MTMTNAEQQQREQQIQHVASLLDAAMETTAQAKEAIGRGNFEQGTALLELARSYREQGLAISHVQWEVSNNNLYREELQTRWKMIDKR